MADNSHGNIDYGANIAGLGLLLNAEKISNTVDLDDMEKKIKTMYNSELEEEDEDEKDEEANIEQEFEEAMEEARTVIDGDDDEEKMSLFFDLYTDSLYTFNALGASVYLSAKTQLHSTHDLVGRSSKYFS